MAANFDVHFSWWTVLVVVLIKQSRQHTDLSNDGIVTCITTSTSLGQPAQVNCQYPIDVRNTSFRPLSLDVEFYQTESTSAVHVLGCELLAGQTDLKCTATEGYTWSEPVDRQLNLNITALSESHLGRYACKMMTPGFDVIDTVPCTIAVEEKPSTTVLIVGGVVGGVLVVVLVLGLVITVKTRCKCCRQLCVTKHCCQDAEKQDKEAQFISTGRQPAGLCCGWCCRSQQEETTRNCNLLRSQQEGGETHGHELEIEKRLDIQKEKDKLAELEQERLAKQKAFDDQKRQEKERVDQVLNENRTGMKAFNAHVYRHSYYPTASTTPAAAEAVPLRSMSLSSSCL